MILPKTRCARRRSWCPGPTGFMTRALIIGSSVKEMNSETSTAAATVIPNSRKNWPTMPPMNATGTNTATMVNVVAMTARPISEVPLRAAVTGSSPLSMCR